MYYKKTFRRPFKNYTPAPRFITPMLAGLSNDDCLVWLQTYTGQDVFISSLKDQLINKGGLSSVQWKMADKNYRNSLPKVQLPTMDLKAPVPIMVNRTAAFKEIRDKYKLQYGVFALKITNIHNAGVARNGNRWAEIEVVADGDSPVNACRVCGKTLTDHASVVTGIGSVCAKKYFPASYALYKKNPQQFIAPFKAEVAKLGKMKIKVWQNQITQNVTHFVDAVELFMKQDPNTAAPVRVDAMGTPTPVMPVAPPKPPTVNEIYWDANAEPWTITENGTYVWEMNSKMYLSIFKNLEFVGGTRYILRVTNILTQNVVDFVTPVVSINTDVISMQGYHNGKLINLHIHNKA